MHVGLTGASGYLGSYVLRELHAAGHTAQCLVRNQPAHLVRSDADVTVVEGDVTDPASLDAFADGCDAIIHLVGIIEEQPGKGMTFDRIHVDGTRHVVAAAQEAGVDRFVHMSANGARPEGGSAYQRSKWHAEQIVKEASFDHWSIFRPSILFGEPDPGRPEFASRLLNDLIRPFPILPVFGDGQYELQPIHVQTVAAALVQALDRDAAHTETFVAAGTERLPYTDVLDIIAQGAGLAPKPKVHVPLSLARLGVYTVGRAGLLPISPAQFEMLIEGNTGDTSAFHNTFPLTPTPFTPQALSYLAA
jgi:NADH dehydrogenase